MTNYILLQSYFTIIDGGMELITIIYLLLLVWDLQRSTIWNLVNSARFQVAIKEIEQKQMDLIKWVVINDASKKIDKAKNKLSGGEK